MDQVVYVVEMLRWGDREKHSYVEGVFSTMEEAEKCGYLEEIWRGGKYQASISKLILNYIDPRVVKYANGEDI